jgi:hypothetical protein
MTARYRCTTWAVAAAMMMAANVHSARAQPAAQTAAPAGGQAEGIGVHGYWVIDVNNPDGSLASHSEFENALTPEGQVALVKALQGSAAIASLYIELDGESKPCFYSFLSITQGSSCLVVPPGQSFTGVIFANTNVFSTLASAADLSGRVVLTGIATASNNGAVDVVRTRAIAGCPEDPLPCDPFTSLSRFTEFSLTPDVGHPNVHPIAVSVGQVIQVSVTLSFS